MSLADFNERVAACIVPLLPAHSSILIGLSGGVDSVVLLHLLHRLAPRYSWQLSALHVHHGISPNADSWADFCTELCAKFNISLHIEYVDIAPLRAHGIEAAARKLRHAAFAGQACDFVALAHHADDQVETLLLQLLRGAGVRGASAMSALSRAEGQIPGMAKRLLQAESGSSPVLLRPLLGCSRKEILEYAEAHELQWIEDESNMDKSYPRNFLRHSVLPLLEEKFPAYRNTLTRSSQHFAEASELLDDLARLDAKGQLSLPKDEWAGKSGDGHDVALEISPLQSLPRHRAKNLLRYFLHSAGAPMPQAVQLDEMLHQLCSARVDAAVCVAYGGCGSNRLREQPSATHRASAGFAPPCQNGYWQVRRYRDRAYVMHALGDFDRNFILPWRGEARLDWHALNTTLVFARTQGDGVSLAKLQRAPVTLRLRCGGELLRPQPNSALRTLKNLLQERRVPPWIRDRMPLLYCGDELVCIPGIAIAAEYQAAPEEAGIQLATG